MSQFRKYLNIVQEANNESIKTVPRGSGAALLGLAPVKHEKGLTVNQQIDAAKKKKEEEDRKAKENNYRRG